MNVRRRVLEPAEGMTPGIGFYVSALDDIRKSTCAEVAGLTDEEFNRRAFEGAHSIAALIMHLGEAEQWWIESIVGGREQAEDVWAQKYTDGMVDPKAFAARGYSVRFCLDAIEEVRAEARRLLSSFADADLERLFTHRNDERTLEVSLRWVLHHLVEHEGQHKGQILMLKRMIRNK